MPKEDTQFKPGNNANPGGRPKGVARRVRELVGEDGDKALQALAMIAWGKVEERKEFFGEDVSVSAKERREAATELLDRGFGRPTQTVEHKGDVPQPRRVSYDRPVDVDLDEASGDDAERAIA